MNVNSQQKAQTISQWIQLASADLSSIGIESSLLDAELILAHTLRKPRTYLHAHGDDILEGQREEIANARLGLRIERTPIAYIVGHKEFYGRRFKTTPAALIPRVESETIIDILGDIIKSNNINKDDKKKLVDVGTGTGCLGITAKLEWLDQLEVTLTDISLQALNLARENSTKLGANVTILKMDLLKGWSQPTDIVIANLPYVDESWKVSPEATKEPSIALYSTKSGLSHIFQLMGQAKNILTSSGYLILEADIRQHDEINKYAEKNGFYLDTQQGYICCFKKI